MQKLNKKNIKKNLIILLISILISIINYFFNKGNNYFYESDLSNNRYYTNVTKEFNFNSRNTLIGIEELKQEIKFFILNNNNIFNENCKSKKYNLFYEVDTVDFIVKIPRSNPNVIRISNISSDQSSGLRCNKFLSELTLKILNNELKKFISNIDEYIDGYKRLNSNDEAVYIQLNFIRKYAVKHENKILKESTNIQSINSIHTIVLISILTYLLLWLLVFIYLLFSKRHAE